MTTICSKCGSSLTADVNFCPQCGAPTSSYYANSGASPHEPTARVAPSKTPSQIRSTNYGSNPYGVPLQNPYEPLNPYEIPPPPPPPSRRPKFGLLIGFVALVLVLVSGSIFVLLSQRAKNSATTPSTTPISTVTSVPSGTLLYAADWSSGLNGWTGTSDWRILNGMLHNDGTDSSGTTPTIVASYQVEGITDYAVEVNMQVVAGGNCLDVTTIRASESVRGWQGYKVTMCNGAIFIVAGNISITDSDQLALTRFDVGNAWRTYRFEAKGTRLSLFIDGKLVLGADDSRYSSGGKLGLKSELTQLNISSFKVFAL
jgi:hypothetical protein